MNELNDILNELPKNKIILDNFIKAFHIINDDKYKNIVCSISGGADSDVMLDICTKADINHKIKYVWFDTGLEYEATKEHLDYLDHKYGIKIIKEKAIKPIPVTCKVYGQPFISKYASEMISRLQRHNFKWEDRSFEELYKEYPKCKIALKWWCNDSGEKSRFNIERNRYLKEFMLQNPPTFKISNKCCLYAKKDVVHKYIENHMCDLNIYGVRRAEGGARSTSYKNCFDENDKCDNYRPLFYYSDQDKREYEIHFDIINSKCYTEYGLRRTGCAGCPFGREFEEELKIIEQYEPKLYKAVNHIFKESYEYTRKYHEFVNMMKNRNKKKNWNKEKWNKAKWK